MKRLAWIDIAKAYGIFLVFYGHYVQVLASAGSNFAQLQLKLIYSFHIPLFFVLSGYLVKPKSQDYGAFLRQKFFSRIVPILFFGLIALPFWTWKLGLGGPAVREIAGYMLAYLGGKPLLNWVTWFLVCLFTVENFSFWLLPALKSPLRTLAAILGSYALGLLLIWKIDLVQDVTGVRLNTWFLHEGLIALSLYLCGYFLKSYSARFSPVTSKKLALLWAAVMLPLVLVTFNLNPGPFNLYPQTQIVVMAVSQHGNALLFPLTALAGSLLVFAAAYLTPDTRLLRFIGANSLVLMGLDGLFLDFFNAKIFLLFGVPAGPMRLLGSCLLATLGSMLVCLPIAYLLNRYLPQLVGKPEIAGPLLPDLVHYRYGEAVRGIFAGKKPAASVQPELRSGSKSD